MAAHNGTVLTHHLALLQKLVEDHALDSGKTSNLDECGSTPERDMNGQTASRIFCTSADPATSESAISNTSIASRRCLSSSQTVLALHHFLFSRGLDCRTVLSMLKIKLLMKHLPANYLRGPRGFEDGEWVG